MDSLMHFRMSANLHSWSTLGADLKLLEVWQILSVFDAYLKKIQRAFDTNLIKKYAYVVEFLRVWMIVSDIKNIHVHYGSRTLEIQSDCFTYNQYKYLYIEQWVSSDT